MSTIKTITTFSRQFKIDVVKLWETSGKTGVEVVMDLGILRDALSRWKREMNEENICK